MAGSGNGSPEPSAGAPAVPLSVLVDTNVALDVLLAREPWASQARPLFDAHDAGRLALYLATSVVTDIFYICRRQVGIDGARAAVSECLRRYALVPVDRAVLEAAAAMVGADFEDNVQIACAQFARLDYIVTRDVAGFGHSPIPALEPAALAARIATP